MMLDLTEKTALGLKHCIKRFKNNTLGCHEIDCPYYTKTDGIRILCGDLFQDALKLLISQEESIAALQCALDKANEKLAYISGDKTYYYDCESGRRQLNAWWEAHLAGLEINEQSQKWRTQTLNEFVSEGPCECWHQEYGKTVCWGTKEREECSCEGDPAKCNFYPDKRRK